MSQNKAFWLHTLYYLHCKEEAISVLIELVFLMATFFKLSASVFVKNIGDSGNIFFHRVI